MTDQEYELKDTIRQVVMDDIFENLHITAEFTRQKGLVVQLLYGGVVVSEASDFPFIVSDD